MELAAFALALAAWTYPGAEGYRRLPELKLACSGLAPTRRRSTGSRGRSGQQRPRDAAGRDLFDVDDNLLSAQIRDSLEALYDLFVEAPVLGSLIAPVPSRPLSTNAISSRYRRFSRPFSNKNEPLMSRSSGR